MRKLRCAILLILPFMPLSLIYAVNDMPVIAAFHGEHHGSFYGYSMVSLDFNHDGFDDLAVFSFAYGYSYGNTPTRGKVYIYYGGVGFNSATTASVTMEGIYANSVGRQIKGIFRVGDVSGDGFDDLCVYVEDHISWNESYKKLLFFYGGTTNLDNPDYAIDFFGRVYSFGRVYPLGDFNGDGYGDIGLYYRHYPSYLLRQSIIFGGSFTEQVVSTGELSSSYASSINGIGDINNDGYADFTTAFATPTTNPTHNLIRLYYGNAAGNTDNPITLIYCQYGVSRGSKPLGDMNGDGYDDFMGYITDEGMHAWLGGTNIDYAEPDFDMSPPWYGGEFQRSLEHGDFNNDGYEDAVGARFGSGFAVWLGKLNVNGTADYIQYNPGYENYGYSLVTGDFNADGYDDIAIAASHEYDPWPNGNFNGYVWVYGGNAELEDTTVGVEDYLTPAVGAPERLRVFPNPARTGDVVTLSYEGAPPLKSEHCEVRLFNIKGQELYSGRASRHHKGLSFDLPKEALDPLPAGIYLISLNPGNGKTATARLVVVE